MTSGDKVTTLGDYRLETSHPGGSPPRSVATSWKPKFETGTNPYSWHYPTHEAGSWP